MAEPDTSGQGVFETRADAGKGGPGVFRLWQTALDLATKDEENWRKRAEEALSRYRDEEKSRHGFNILYSSVQSQEPAIYNSTPVPDVRRRFGDEDPVGKIAAQAFERALSHCIDEYDFDCTMEAVVHDSLLPGRGVAIVEYVPTVEGETVSYETTRTRHVQWDDFRRGPGKTWNDVPWIAIRDRITRDEAVALNPKEGPTVNLDYVEKNADKEKDAKDVPDVFKRLTVWKIWDKTQRRIIFHAPSYKDGPFAVEEDLLKLKDFFPCPRPIYDVLDTSSLIPIVPYDLYRTQAEELDRITRRLHSLINVLKWRGIRPSQIEELDRLKDADDGDLIPSQSFDALMMTQGASADKAIWLMPIDKLIVVIRELVVQREAIKQVVFEISGLADIMRGETDPNETLGAQQIKAQWGSLRMQRRQREAQRFARDLLRIKAEIIGEHFSPDTLSMITNIHLPTAEQKQAAQLQMQQMQMSQQEPPPELAQVMNTPTWDEVRQIMSNDALRSFRVDIETDSTIQADQTRAQQNMGVFVEGLGGLLSALGPAVESGVMQLDVAADIVTALGRNFRLGRQFEDAMDRLGKQAKQPKPEQPDPEAMKAQAELQKMQAEMQLDQQKAQQDAQMEQQKAQAEMVRKEREAEIDAQIDRMKAETDIQIARMKAQADIQIEQMKAGIQARLDEERAAREEDRADEAAKREAKRADV